MKKYAYWLVAAVLAVAMVAPALADEDEKGDGQKDRKRTRRKVGDGVRQRLAARRGGEGQGDRMFAGLNLTDEQRAKIREIMEEARKKIHDTVLTDEQKKKVEELREKMAEGRGRMDLGLTEEQKKAMQEARNTLREAMKNAKIPEDRKAAAEAHRDAMQKILTEEQMDKIKSMRGAGVRGPEGRRPRGRGDDEEEGAPRGRRGRGEGKGRRPRGGADEEDEL